MPVDDILLECDEQMEKAVQYLRQELRGVRTGQASPALVEHMKISVESYGSTMELRELAGVSAPESNQLLIKPYDPSVLKDIERAIQTSDLGISPMNDGKMIRLPIPPLSGERRKQLLNQVGKLAENQKIAIRNLRRDANRKIDAELKEKNISEDDAKGAKDEIQEMTNKYEAQVEGLAKSKSSEIQEV